MCPCSWPGGYFLPLNQTRPSCFTLLQQIALWTHSLALLLVFNVYLFSFYQYEVNGKVADSMLVNTILMLVYVTKFFWWEAGYWSTMDIAHDRGSTSFYFNFPSLLSIILLNIILAIIFWMVWYFGTCTNLDVLLFFWMHTKHNLYLWIKWDRNKITRLLWSHHH